ncbi:M14 family metallopeptidase [candidate division KSB1 bacterium]|nr:M14 family metallopeptidase [candidate division KSB1 bacterium]
MHSIFSVIKRRFIFVLPLAVLTGFSGCSQSQTQSLPPELYSRAERTNFEETSLHSDVMNFVNTLDRYSDLVRVEIYGQTIKGRDLPLVIMSDPPVSTPEEAIQSGKIIVYINGNIHGGEVEGKEASMEIMREIALENRRYLLENQIILFGPIFNADGNDSLTSTGRSSQEGSPLLAGQRNTSEGNNLNRDGTKLEAPETKGLMKNVILKWDPAVFVDLHTTNGSWNGYALTYSPSYHSAGNPKTSDYTMDVMLPAIRKDVYDRSGLQMYLYGGFRGNPPTRWTTYSHSPRYLTNSMGLRNRIGILSETFAHDSYEKRIFSSKMFVLSILEYTNKNGPEIMQTNKEAESETVMQIRDNAGQFQKGVQFQVVPLDEPFELLVRETNFVPNEPAGAQVAGRGGRGEGRSGRGGRGRGGRGRGRNVPTGRILSYPGVLNYNKYEPTLTSTVPRGYVFPADFQVIADKLSEHGITVTKLSEATTFEGEEYIVNELEVTGTRFNRHTLVNLNGIFRDTSKEFPAGSYKVDLAQPLAYLTFYLLEPQSDDGLATWNYFDDYLKAQGIENNSVLYPIFKYFR